MPEATVTLREEDLDFTFDPGWAVCRHWDTEAVRLALGRQVPGSKGVDIIGVRGDPGAIYLIEVKDYRTSEDRGTTREKFADGGAQLAVIVAAKARDTVAGLLGAALADRDPDCNAPDAPSLKRYGWSCGSSTPGSATTTPCAASGRRSTPAF